MGRGPKQGVVLCEVDAAKDRSRALEPHPSKYTSIMRWFHRNWLLLESTPGCSHPLQLAEDVNHGLERQSCMTNTLLIATDSGRQIWMDRCRFCHFSGHHLEGERLESRYGYLPVWVSRGLVVGRIESQMLRKTMCTTVLPIITRWIFKLLTSIKYAYNQRSILV